MILLLSSCTNSNKNVSIKSAPIASANNSAIKNNILFKFPIQTYGVYEVYNSNSIDNDFDKIMIENKIDKKMTEELKTIDISGTRESQIYYSKYVEKWQSELAYSITNLEKYLTADEIKNLQAAQIAWENSLNSNNTFDRTLIGSKGVGLGTQYVSSSLIYMISQYRDRVFHIKYMTMLAEEYVENPVPEDKQLWNKFSVTE